MRIYCIEELETAVIFMKNVSFAFFACLEFPQISFWSAPDQDEIRNNLNIFWSALKI